ncbi:MAG: WD40 repeat domain-containing protein [Crinalium sp.]
MKFMTRPWFWLSAMLLLNVASCASQQTTTLSVPSEIDQNKLVTIPQPPPECPETGRVTYDRLNGILEGKTGSNEQELQALDRQVLASMGPPKYAKRNDKEGDIDITYEWLSPECPGFFIHASFRSGFTHLYMGEVPPPIATISPQTPTSGLRYTLVGHPREVRSVTITPDEQTLISGGGEIHFWRLSDGKHLRVIEPGDWINDLQVSLDGKTLFSLGSDVTTWNVATGNLIQQWQVSSGGITHNSFSLDQRLIVRGINGEVVNLWDIATHKQLRSFSQPRHWMGQIALHPNNRILADVQAQGFGNKNPILVWDLLSGKKLHSLSGHTYIVGAMLFSPNGQILATGSEEVSLPSYNTSEIKLWNWQEGILIKTLTGQSGGVRAIAFSTDGQRLAAGSRDGKIYIWRVSTGELLQTLTGHTDAVIALTFSPSNKFLISGSDDRTVKVWQLN